MAKSTENAVFDFIVKNNIATEAEVCLVTNINGYSVKTLNDIIYCRTGYRSVSQLLTCEPENYIDYDNDFTEEDDEEEEDED